MSARNRWRESLHFFHFLARQYQDTRVRVGIVLLCLPLVYFTVMVLTHGWIPQGDEALVAVRVHDVWSSHPPLVGMRTTSSATNPGVYAHHPGPIEFYLLAIPYAITGFAAWSLIVGDLIVAAFFVATAVWSGYQASGLNGAWIAAALVILVERSFGPVLVQPLNTWPAVLALVTSLMLAWRLVLGQYKAMPWYVGCASYAAQAHVIDFSALAVLSTAISGLGLLRWWDRRGVVWPLAGDGEPTAPWWRRPGWTSILIGLIVWLPPIVEIFVGHPNNLIELTRTVLGSDGTKMLGVGTSMWYLVSLMLPTGQDFTNSGAVLHNPVVSTLEAIAVGGVLVYAVWAGRATFRGGRSRHRRIGAAAVVAVVGLFALVWIGARAAFPLQLLYLNLIQPMALFGSVVAVWWVCHLVVGHLVHHERLPRWKGLAGGMAASLTALCAFLLPTSPAVSFLTTRATVDHQRAVRVVNAAQRLLAENRVADKPVVVSGYGAVSYLSLSSAVSLALIADGDKVYFDTLWPLPQDDDFRRSKNAPASSFKLVIRERTGNGPWSLSKVPGQVMGTSTIAPVAAAAPVTIEILLTR